MRAPLRVWVHDFDDATLQSVAECVEGCAAAGQSLLPVYIASMGGSVWHMLAMVDMLRAHKDAGGKVVTVAIGHAISAGADLLASGSKGERFVAAHATVMVHEARGRAQGQTRDVAVQAEELQRLDSLALALLDEHTSKRAGWWARRLTKNGHADLYLSPEQAVEIGLADRVGVPIVSREMSTELRYHGGDDQ